jgi:hypothetical protein
VSHSVKDAAQLFVAFGVFCGNRKLMHVAEVDLMEPLDTLILAAA